MEKYAIFLDIDGTLIHFGAIPAENVRAIEEAVANGHYVFINTGRSYSCIEDYIKQTAPLSGFVSGLGTHIVFENRTVKSVAVSTDYLKKAYHIIKKADVACLYEGENICIGQGEKATEIWGSFVKDYVFSEDEFDTKYASERISKMTVIPRPKKEEIDALREFFDIVETPDLIEVVTKGCSKGNGMLEIAEKLGVKQQNCIAMGDSENDITMFESAGISVAMNNAPDHIKKICDFVSTGCCDGGVAYAIDKLVLKK